MTAQKAPWYFKGWPKNSLNIAQWLCIILKITQDTDSVIHLEGSFDHAWAQSCTGLHAARQSSPCVAGMEQQQLWVLRSLLFALSVPLTLASSPPKTWLPTLLTLVQKGLELTSVWLAIYRGQQDQSTVAFATGKLQPSAVWNHGLIFFLFGLCV